MKQTVFAVVAVLVHLENCSVVVLKMREDNITTTYKRVYLIFVTF